MPGTKRDTRPRMLYLASQSPRRRELLGQLGVDFTVLDTQVPEQRLPGEAPGTYVRRVARAKAAARLELVRDVDGALVLGADTDVVLDDEVFGKPRDAADAAAMLRRLSARTHRVISTVWLLGARGEYCAECISRVTFGALEARDIDAYVATGEPFGRAGAYAIQGRGATLVAHLEGSHSGVMGLPLFETARLLRDAGAHVPSPADAAW